MDSQFHQGKISIIIPIYNGAKYFKRCMDTILNQTYSNLQIVLVNDGSTDESPLLCDEFAKIDERVTVIHKKNGGLSTARNAGLKKCNGEYIGFADADDWAALDMFECLHAMFIENDVDIAEVGLAITHGEVTTIKQTLPYYTKLSDKEILKDYLYTLLKTGDYSFCTCLFKRSIFNDYTFLEGKINTDLDDKYRALSHAKRYIRSNQVKYYYFQNPGSLTYAGLKSRDFNIFDSASRLIELTKNETADMKKLAKMKAGRAYFSLLAKIAYFGFNDQELNTKETIQKLITGLRKNLGLLLKSPIPLNRKLMMVVISMDYRLLKIPLFVYRKVLGR